MIDFHKGIGKLANPIKEVLNNSRNPFEAFETTFKMKTPGIYVSESNQKYKDVFRLTLKYPDEIKVENSLHKYLHGGFNVFDLSYSEMINGITTLYSDLNVTNVNSVEIYSPEFECPIQVDCPEMLYNSMLSLKNKKLLDMASGGHACGKYINTDTYKIKGYSKYLQMKGEPLDFKAFNEIYPGQIGYLQKNFRIEFKVFKNRCIGLKGRPLYIEDLKDKVFINKIYDDFIRTVGLIELESKLLNDTNYSEGALMSYTLLTHPNHSLKRYFQQDNNNKFQYLKKIYKSFPAKYISAETLMNLMIQKKNTLLN